MAIETKIAWAHSTFNGWIGCSHALMANGTESPLCQNCYAERQNLHRKWNGGEWGPGTERKLTSENYWLQPFRWNIKASSSTEPWRVFAFSLADIFDEDGPIWPMDRLIQHPHGNYRFGHPVLARDVFLRAVVASTPSLTWLLLTKRFDSCMRVFVRNVPPPDNAWVIFSAGTQGTFDEAMQHLPYIRTRVHGISAEPLLGPINISRYKNCLDWVIVGGESGPNARLMDPAWERDLRLQCQEARIPYFFKQTGNMLAKQLGIPGVGADRDKWPAEMQVQEFPTWPTLTAMKAWRAQ